MSKKNKKHLLKIFIISLAVIGGLYLQAKIIIMLQDIQATVFNSLSANTEEPVKAITAPLLIENVPEPEVEEPKSEPEVKQQVVVREVVVPKAEPQFDFYKDPAVN